MLEQGNAFFDTLIGLTGAARTTGAAAVSAQDVEFLDRVHPATRGAPLLRRRTPDDYYSWTNNPTGQVHTVARVRFNTLPDGSSVTNDAIIRFTGATDREPAAAASAPVSWCRDIQQGRSFYTGLGGTAASLRRRRDQRSSCSAPSSGPSGMIRGNCKATITSNYRADAA